MNDLQARILSKTSEMTVRNEKTVAVDGHSVMTCLLRQKVEGRLGAVASEKDEQISELRQVIEELRRQKLEMETRIQKEMVQCVVGWKLI